MQDSTEEIRNEIINTFLQYCKGKEYFETCISQERHAGTHRVKDKLPKYIRSNIKKLSDYEYNKYDASFTASYFCSDFNVTKLFPMFIREHEEFLKGSFGSEYFELRLLNKVSAESNKFHKVKIKSWNIFNVQLPLPEIMQDLNSELTSRELKHMEKLLIVNSANPPLKDKRGMHNQAKVPC